ncbi:MAG: carbon-nitrogen family hydrolase [Verrucomicrobia bacterium]|nr:carbon-nitrogen family hydrolase [Verrucomicrobiota bacterium]
MNIASVICCQMDIQWEDKAANFDLVQRLLSNSKIPPESLIVLPELAFTGFSMQVSAVSANEPQMSEGFLSTMAKVHNSYVLAGIGRPGPEQRGRNEAVLIGPSGKVAGRYRKTHLFSPADEHRYYDAGSEAVILNWRGMRIAPIICYDLRFPELFRDALDLGAEMFVVIANWPAVREQHWTTLLRARAIENQAYVIGVNRCGSDPFFAYSGKSMAIAPDGTLLLEMGSEQGLGQVPIDFENCQEYRNQFPAVADRKRIPTFLLSADTRV